MEKLLLLAVRGKNIYGEDSLFFRCEEHGLVKEDDLKSGFTRRLGCMQCVALGIFYRRAIAEQSAVDPLAPGEQVHESLLKACEDALRGQFDFQPTAPRVNFGDAKDGIPFTDIPQKRVF